MYILRTHADAAMRVYPTSRPVTFLNAGGWGDDYGSAKGGSSDPAPAWRYCLDRKGDGIGDGGERAEWRAMNYGEQENPI